jgi:chromosomal replication initiator protein
MMTFASFVVSKRSEAALAACIAMSERRDDAPHPLFLCGPTGSGKSHLLHAIADALRARVVSAESWINSLVDAIRADQLDALRGSLAETGALLLDDFGSAADRPHTRAEMLAQIEKLVQRGVSVVATTHEPASTVRSFIDGTASGRVVEIGHPDLAARIEIARRLALSRDVVLSSAMLQSIARRTSGSPRKLQGVILRITAETTLLHAPIDAARLRNLIAQA